MTVATHLQHDLADEVQPALFVLVVLVGVPLTEGDRGKGKVAAAAGNRVELEFQRLETLFELAHDVLAGNFRGLGFVQTQFHVLFEGRLFAL